jgi:DNA-binding NtrC family response regulator
LLAEHFLERFAADMAMAKPKLSAAALQVLQSYAYPGNIRELRNFIERALIEGGGGEIGPEHLFFIRCRGQPAASLNDMVGQPAPVPASESMRVRETLLPEEQSILDFVKQRGSINNTECRELLGVGMQRACYLLRKIHLTGLLHRESNGRWSQYRLPVPVPGEFVSHSVRSQPNRP